MKKSFVKLVSVSLAAATIATAVAPVANAAYYSPALGKNYHTLTGVQQKDYDALLSEISAAIVSVKGQIGLESNAGRGASGQVAVVESAEAAKNTAAQAAADAQAAYDKAKADDEAAIVELREAKNAQQAAQDALDAIANVNYGEFETKKQAAVATKAQADDAALSAYNTAVANAENTEIAAQNAYNEYQAYVNSLVVDSSLPEDVYATQKAEYDAALVQLESLRIEAGNAATTAANLKAEAKTVYDNTLASNDATYNQTIDALEQEYADSDVYGQRAKKEQAELDLNAAKERVATATTNKATTGAALTAADTANKAAQAALATAQADLVREQAKLQDLFAQKANLESNLHELVVGQQGNVTEPSRANLTDEQQAVVEEISGKTSEELAQQKAEAEAKAQELQAEADKLAGQAGQNVDAPNQGGTQVGGAQDTPQNPTEDPAPGFNAQGEVILNVANVFEGDTVVTGTTAPNAQVTITFPSATANQSAFIQTVSAQTIGSNAADANGNFSVAVPAGVALKAGDVITVTANAGNGNKTTVDVTVQARGAVAGARRGTQNRTGATLPETGENSSYAVFGAAALSVLAGLGLVAPKFRKED